MTRHPELPGQSTADELRRLADILDKHACEGPVMVTLLSGMVASAVRAAVIVDFTDGEIASTGTSLHATVNDVRLDVFVDERWLGAEKTVERTEMVAFSRDELAAMLAEEKVAS